MNIEDEDNFNITVSSNACNKIYKNTRSNFTNNINLNRELKGSWEIAPVSIQYTASWRNIIKEYRLLFRVGKSNQQNFDIDVLDKYDGLAYPEQPAYDPFALFETLFYADEWSSILYYNDTSTGAFFEIQDRSWLDDSGELPDESVGIPRDMIPLMKYETRIPNIIVRKSENPKRWIFRSIILRGYFRDQTEVCDRLNQILKYVFQSSSLNPRIELQFDKGSNILSVKCRYDLYVEIFSDRPDFFQWGNLPYHECTEKFPLRYTSYTGKVFRLISPWCPFTPSTTLKTISTLFVYTDIIKDQIVADQNVKLLATIPVFNDVNGTQYRYRFNPLLYLQLANTNTLDKINIRIHDEEGDEVEMDEGIVLIEFRLRRKKLYK